jgi:NADH dehydrogenase FAD-containing subunit
MQPMQQRVVVVGGGYGGAAVAKALDDVADVVLVEPKDAFVHAVGALRAAVDPDWQDRVFIPYDRLLAHGRVVQDWVRTATPTQVRLSADEVIDADYLVLATGSGYPFPAKFLENQMSVAGARLARLREALARAERVLIVGAGPVGLELAGELTSSFRDLAVTVVDQQDDILMNGDVLPEVRASIRTQLEARGVLFELGAPLGYLPPSDVGTFEPFTVSTASGREITAQLWFRCHDASTTTGYLGTELARRVIGGGRIQVTNTLNVVGYETVFAIGDITDIPESKRASAARAHAGVVAANIASLIAGRPATATYAPAPELIVLPLGPDGGASQLVDTSGARVVRGPKETSAIKGTDLMTEPMIDLFGREPVRISR